MTEDALVLIGREGTHARGTLETHADRLAGRGAIDAVRVATYAEEPSRELRGELSSLAADTVFAMPASLAHSRETTDVLPAAFSCVSGDVRYCEPIGWSPAVTRLITDRATAELDAGVDATLVLVGQGNSSQSYHRQMTRYHATRIAEHSSFADVVTCYLLENPAVECVRYNVETDRAVAVPLFLTENETTARRIPEKLELDRGGIDYADPLGTDPLVTDAIEGELARQRALAETGVDRPASFEGALVRGARTLATDGEGVPR